MSKRINRQRIGKHTEMVGYGDSKIKRKKNDKQGESRISMVAAYVDVLIRAKLRSYFASIYIFLKYIYQLFMVSYWLPTIRLINKDVHRYYCPRL